jgi:hypothetical protein
MRDDNVSQSKPRFHGCQVPVPGRDLRVKCRGNCINGLYDWLEGRDFLSMRADRKPLLIATWQPQIEGGKTGRELPAMVDEIITITWIDFGRSRPAPPSEVSKSRGTGRRRNPAHQRSAVVRGGVLSHQGGQNHAAENGS